MAKGKAVKAGANLVRNIAEEVGEAVSRKPAQTPWGWRGGKPGEPEAHELWGMLQGKDNVAKNVRYVEDEVFNRFAQKYPDSMYGKYWNAVHKKNGMKVGLQEAAEENLDLASHLFFAQQAGIPRKFTGRVVDAVTRDYKRTVTNYKEISAALEPLSDEGRDFFLKMMPTWEGSLDDLARTVVAVLS
jgi:hypothetical protein